PRIPPTPFSVNPNPSWIGVNSAEMMMMNENPLCPSGNFVSMIPNAFTAPAYTDSASAPLYFESSNVRNPPPDTGPPFTAIPMPLGGLNPMSASAGPTLPPPSGNV